MVTRIVAQEVASQATQKARRAAKVVRKGATRAATGVLRLAGERMSKVDTAWLRMDSPSNLMMIIGVWTLSPGIKHADLCRRVEERLLKFTPDEFKPNAHHWLILHGRYVCVARTPKCPQCVIVDLCEYNAKTRALPGAPAPEALPLLPPAQRRKG